MITVLSFIFLAVSGMERSHPKEEWDIKKMWDVSLASY
jgi:hypothetical protein